MMREEQYCGVLVHRVDHTVNICRSLYIDPDRCIMIHRVKIESFYKPSKSPTKDHNKYVS
jgi:hypothetical protein